MMRYALLLLCIAALNIPLNAQQTKVDEYLLQREQIKKTELLRELDSGVYYMETGNYKVADKKFQYVLANVKSVPSDLTFFFGKNSYHLQQYKQSIDWLNKYIQLKGTNGQYSEEAVEWLKKSESEFLKETANASVKAEQILSRNFDIDCGPSGKVTCPVCKGDHVVVTQGAFGPGYKTCGYCNEHGWLSCQAYNQLIRGELQPRQ